MKDFIDLFPESTLNFRSCHNVVDNHHKEMTRGVRSGREKCAKFIDNILNVVFLVLLSFLISQMIEID